MKKKSEDDIASLKREIKALKKKLEQFQHNRSSFSAGNTVDVPENVAPYFRDAEKTVGRYFSDLHFSPSTGSIRIQDERYVLVRASSLSYEFFKSIASLYKNRSSEEAAVISKNFLFDIGHVLGAEDAKRFHQKMKLQKPIEKLSAGPVHFAYAGWAFVKILPESNPEPNDNFYLKYLHPYSFEADSWIKNNVKSKVPVCTMNAAYSSGWCQESFGIELTAVEITCKAKGDKECCFIMAPPHKINSYLEKEMRTLKVKQKPEVPYFFERKKIEDEFIKNQHLLNEAQKMAKLGSWEFNLITQELVWSDELYRIYQIDKNKIDKNKLYQEYLNRLPDEDKSRLFHQIDEAVKKKKEYTIKHAIKLPDGITKWIVGSGVPILNERKQVVSLMGIARDITTEVLQQEKLEANLREKETLLKEVHHRVKNNLQIISSLLNLQSETIQDADAKEKYRESLGRVKSMALIHELLYQTKNLSNLKANQYLNELVKFITETYNLNKKVSVKLSVDPLIKRIEMNKAIPCGLIINELVSNAFKYAFGKSKNGEIKIEFKVLKNHPFNYRLGVRDNGTGLPAKLNSLQPNTLGLQLVQSLTSQLDGELRIKNSNGAIFEIDFN
jgi:two-component sensor histidine kinase/PAS domain-containing protein